MNIHKYLSAVKKEQTKKIDIQNNNDIVIGAHVSGLEKSKILRVWNNIPRCSPIAPNTLVNTPLIQTHTHEAV